MEAGTLKLLESATYRTLHAHGFSRSSSQASFLLSDLLARYLTLLSSTCAKYAQHAGRAGVTPRDAICALDELGVSLEELKEYCVSEGAELGRYAVHSGRRVEDLNELKAHLADGLRQDRDDAIPLFYGPAPPSPIENTSEEEVDETAEEEASRMQEDEQGSDSGVDLLLQVSSFERKEYPTAARPPSIPPLPLSPISNPSSPARKRPRTAKWRPPSHIPDFLPPFPSQDDSDIPLPATQSLNLPPMQPPPIKIDKPPSPPPPLTATSTSDYFTRIPYSESSLSTVPDWHLPSTLPPSTSSALPRTPRMPTPQTQPALIAAYHHILTHPPPLSATSANPARHKVAMALLTQTQANSRWDLPDTLYSSIAPCQPRVAAFGPTFPIPQGKTSLTPLDSKVSKFDEQDKETKFPAAQPRPVYTNERLTALISQQPSRIPELARLVLPASVYQRATRLTHPPVIHRGTEKLLYGNGVPAPWNANAAPLAGAAPPTPVVKSKETNSQVNGKGKEILVKPALQDARLFATWDYETKSFKEPLAPVRRSRMGSVQSGSGVRLSLGIGGRGRSHSKTG